MGLGEDAEALSDFERFLDEAPYAPKRSRDEATRAAEVLRPKLAYLEIEVQDAGSAVALDGHDVGESPLPRPLIVTPGAHEVRVVKSGMNEEVRKVSPIAGQKLRVVVKLTAVAAPVAAARSPAAPAASNAEPAGTAPEADVKPQGPGSADEAGVAGRPWQLTAAWVAVGAGVVFLGTGVAAEVISSHKFADFNAVNDAPNPTQHCNEKLSDYGGGQCKSLDDQGHQWRTWALVGFAASGVALAGALVFYLVSPSSPSGERQTAAACIPSANLGVSCALTLTF